jgi:hypothetical protein
MSRNSSQIGHTPIERLSENKENESNMDQLSAISCINTSRPTIPFNPRNMIPSQIPIISNSREQNNNNNNNNHHHHLTRRQEGRRRRRQRQRQRRRERQEAMRQQQRNQEQLPFQQQRRGYGQRNAQGRRERYEQWQARLHQCELERTDENDQRHQRRHEETSIRHRTLSIHFQIPCMTSILIHFWKHMISNKWIQKNGGNKNNHMNSKDLLFLNN